jgi:hypothetical protein
MGKIFQRIKPLKLINVTNLDFSIYKLTFTHTYPKSQLSHIQYSNKLFPAENLTDCIRPMKDRTCHFQ